MSESGEKNGNDSATSYASGTKASVRKGERIIPVGRIQGTIVTWLRRPVSELSPPSDREEVWQEGSGREGAS